MIIKQEAASPPARRAARMLRRQLISVCRPAHKSGPEGYRKSSAPPGLLFCLTVPAEGRADRGNYFLFLFSASGPKS